MASLLTKFLPRIRWTGEVELGELARQGEDRRVVGGGGFRLNGTSRVFQGSPFNRLSDSGSDILGVASPRPMNLVR